MPQAGQLSGTIFLSGTSVLGLIDLSLQLLSVAVAEDTVRASAMAWSIVLESFIACLVQYGQLVYRFAGMILPLGNPLEPGQKIYYRRAQGRVGVNRPPGGG